MSKNVVFWVGVKNEQYSEKYGGWEWMDISRKTWEYWCKKHDVVFFPFEKPINDNLVNYRINWQKSIYCFDLLDEAGIDYDQIFLADATCMVKWDMPNVFELTDNKFTAWRETDNLNWVYEGIQGYKDIFGGYDLDISKYFNSGFVIINKSHEPLLKKFKEKYLSQSEDFLHLQKTVKRGTCQPPLNYIMHMINVDINYAPPSWNVSHLPRKELLNHNWQLNESKTPHFIKYGYIWGFSGFD